MSSSINFKNADRIEQKDCIYCKQFLQLDVESSFYKVTQDIRNINNDTLAETLHEMEDYTETTFKAVAKVGRFSDLSMDTEQTWLQIDTADYNVRSSIALKYIRVCPNRRSLSDETGSVSVKAHLSGYSLHKSRDVQLTVVLSVVDAEGNSRFPRSFLFIRRCFNFTIDDYISSSVLLNEPSEFLPDDTLTLQMDIVIGSRGDSRIFLNEYKNLLNLSPIFRNWFSLDVDSPGVNRLAWESKYFQRILENPMTEQNNGKVILPIKEYDTFRLIERIFFGFGTIRLFPVYEILDLYATADKYDLPTVLDICRRWLKLSLSPENVSEISELADLYGDDRLKEVVRHFQRNEEDGTIGNSSDSDEEWCVSDLVEDPTSGDTFYQFTRRLLPAEQENKSGSDVFNTYI